MKSKWLVAGAACAMAATVGAQDLTWTKDIQPLIKAQCGMCHGASAPSYEEWNASTRTSAAHSPLVLRTAPVRPAVRTVPQCARRAADPGRRAIAVDPRGRGVASAQAAALCRIELAQPESRRSEASARGDEHVGPTTRSESEMKSTWLVRGRDGARWPTTAGAQDLTWSKDDPAADQGAVRHRATARARRATRNGTPTARTSRRRRSARAWTTLRATASTMTNAAARRATCIAFLGASDADRAKNLATIKAWLGDGAWNLNRWEARDNVPAVTKAQLDKVKAKY